MKKYKSNIVDEGKCSGNILFIILIAIGLMAALSIAVTQGFSGAKSTSDQEMQLHAEKVLRYADSVKRAVQFLYTTKDISETEFLFAHPKNHSDFGNDLTVNADRQVFNHEGGGASFWWPIPEGINDGTPWEFTGRTRAPGVGEDVNAELMIALVNVTENFCRTINSINGYSYSDSIPTDSATCGFIPGNRWAGSYSATNNMRDGGNTALWQTVPASYACVECSDSSLHFYYVLHER